MKPLLSLPIMISFFVLSSCQKEASKDTKAIAQEAALSLKAAQQDRPFKGSFTTASEVLQPAPFLRTRITGSGQLTHLGQSTFIAVSNLNLTTQPPFQLGGTATFTAANGDAFYTTFTGNATPTGQGTLAVFMSHEITGGTGRFRHASGSFAGNTIASPGHTEGFIEHEGTIRY